MQMCVSIPTRATEAGGTAGEEGEEDEGDDDEFLLSSSTMEGVYMENLVLSCAGEGSSAAMEGTVGPSLATVWVVAWTGIEKALAKVRSFCVVRTLFGEVIR
jgi:hypothetical protein